MITYLIDNKKYLDFPTIIRLFNYSRTHTYHVLIDNNISFIEYKNSKLYSKNEIMEYRNLIDVREYLNEKRPSNEIIELLLKYKKENSDEVRKQV